MKLETAWEVLFLKSRPAKKADLGASAKIAQAASQLRPAHREVVGNQIVLGARDEIRRAVGAPLAGHVAEAFCLLRDLRSDALAPPDKTRRRGLAKGEVTVTIDAVVKVDVAGIESFELPFQVKLVLEVTGIELEIRAGCVVAYQLARVVAHAALELEGKEILKTPDANFFEGIVETLDPPVRIPTGVSKPAVERATRK